MHEVKNLKFIVFEELRKYFSFEMVVHGVIISGMLLINSISNFTLGIYIVALVVAVVSFLQIGLDKNKIVVIRYNDFLRKRWICIFGVLVFLILWPAVTLVYSANAEYGSQKIFVLLVSVLPFLYYTGFTVFKYRKDEFQSILLVLIAVGLVLCGGAIFLQTFDPGSGYKFSLTRWSHVTTGRYLTILMPTAMWMLLNGKDRFTKLLLGLFISIGVYTLYISSFRAGILWVVIITPVIVSIYFYRKKKTWIDMAWLALPVLIGILVSYYFAPVNPTIEMRYETLLSLAEGRKEVSDASINARREGAEIALQMMTDNLLLGVGFGGFKQEYGGKSVGLIIAYPHNLFLEVFAELGSIYGILFTVLLAFTAVWLYRPGEGLFLILYITFVWLAMFSKSLPSNAGVLVFSALCLVRGSWLGKRGS